MYSWRHCSVRTCTSQRVSKSSRFKSSSLSLAWIARDGLVGVFSTEAQIAYVTSLPASVVVTAKGGNVLIFDSHIQTGKLVKPSLALDYFDKGTDLSHMSGQFVSSGFLTGDGQGVEPGTSVRRLNMIAGSTEGLTVGKDGILNGTASLLITRVKWPSFEAATSSVTFFAAAAAFGDNPSDVSLELNAPMPAENAWKQLPGPFGGDLDPGLNIIRLHADDDVTYDCYDRTFDTDLDLYVRRGGVSENLRINTGDVGQIRDVDGYFKPPLTSGGGTLGEILSHECHLFFTHEGT